MCREVPDDVPDHVIAWLILIRPYPPPLPTGSCIWDLGGGVHCRLRALCSGGWVGGADPHADAGAPGPRARVHHRELPRGGGPALPEGHREADRDPGHPHVRSVPTDTDIGGSRLHGTAVCRGQGRAGRAVPSPPPPRTPPAHSPSPEPSSWAEIPSTLADICPSARRGCRVSVDEWPCHRTHTRPVASSPPLRPLLPRIIDLKRLSVHAQATGPAPASAARHK